MCWVSTFFSWKYFLYCLVECSVVVFHSTLADLTLFVLYSEMLKFSNYIFSMNKTLWGKTMDSFSKFWSIILFNMESLKWDNCSTLKCSTCYGTTVMGLPSHISKCTQPSRCILSVDNKWQLTQAAFMSNWSFSCTVPWPPGSYAQLALLSYPYRCICCATGIMLNRDPHLSYGE
jgi:hypothetical protein